MKTLGMLLVLALLRTNAAAQAPNGLLGRWLSEKKDAQIEIYPQGGQLAGRLVQTSRPEALDVQNPNPKLRTRPVLGLVILTSLQASSEGWEGKIYDPESGKTYSATLKLADSGRRLDLRGYVGFSLLGRTSVWTRL